MTEKPWGTSTRVLITDFLQVELIDVVAGGYSSIHRHLFKYNLFAVQSGVLTIKTFRDSIEIHQTDLNSGEYVVAEPNLRHQFHAKIPAKAYEVYWPKEGAIDPDDIERFSSNGVKDAGVYLSPGDIPIYCCACNRRLEQYHIVIWHRATRQMCPECRKNTNAECVVMP